KPWPWHQSCFTVATRETCVDRGVRGLDSGFKIGFRDAPRPAQACCLRQRARRARFKSMNGNPTLASIEMRMAERRGPRERASGSELTLASMETRLTEPRYE